MARVSGRTDSDRVLLALGASIRAHRKELGVSQEALAHSAGIDRSHMGKIERGERNITLLNLMRIADALGCKGSRLLSLAGL